MADTADEAQAAIEAVVDEYRPRIVALLETLRGHITDCGWEAEEVTENGGDFVWAVVARTADGRLVSFDFEIAEAIEFGDDDVLDGLNFGLTILEWGGRILGQLTPYNYTPACWVHASDPEAVAERFAILERAITDGEDEVADVLAQARETSTTP